MDKLHHDLFYDISLMTPKTITAVVTWNYTFSDFCIAKETFRQRSWRILTKPDWPESKRLSVQRCCCRVLKKNNIKNKNNKFLPWECLVLKTQFAVRFRTIQDAFRWAARNELLSVCYFLKNFGLDITFGHGYVLYDSAYRGLLSVCQFFKDCGVTASHNGIYFHDALKMSAKNGHLDVCKLLVEWPMVMFDILRSRAFESAAKNGHMHICQFLMEYLLSSGQDKRTITTYIRCHKILRRAAGSGCLDVFHFFRNFDLDVKQSDFLGTFDLAAKNGHVHICKYLKDLRGLGYNEDYGGLMRAANNGHLQVCQLLRADRPQHVDWSSESWCGSKKEAIVDYTCQAARCAWSAGHMPVYDFLSQWVFDYESVYGGNFRHLLIMP